MKRSLTVALAATAMVGGCAGGGAQAKSGAKPYQRGMPGAASDSYATGRVTSRTPLNIRSKPTTASRRLATLKPGTTIDIKCKTNGQSVRRNRTWYRLGLSTKEYVSARYVKIIKGNPPRCS